MNSTTFATEMARNRAAYELHREEIRSAAPGYVAIAHGKVVSLTATFDEAAKAVRQLQPPAEHFLLFPVDEEPAFELIDSFSQRL